MDKWKNLLQRKFKNPKASYTFNEALVLSIICDKCGSNDDKIFTIEESIEILKILGLIDNINEQNILHQIKKFHTLLINRTEKSISQKFRLQKLDKWEIIS